MKQISPGSGGVRGMTEETVPVRRESLVEASDLLALAPGLA